MMVALTAFKLGEGEVGDNGEGREGERE